MKIKENYFNLQAALLGLPIHIDIALEGWTLQILITFGPEPGAPKPPGEYTKDLEVEDKLDRLLAEGAGRRKIADELGITEHQARVLIADRNGEAGGNL